MRFLFILFLSLLILQQNPALAQTQKEIQAQMKEAVNEIKKQIAELEKQITEAKKNKEDDSVIKELEDQMAMLKKQLEMMGGVSKGISTISEKTFKQASEQDNNNVPRRDDARIKSLPDKILSDAELVPYLKNIAAEVEKKISAEDKMKAEELRTGIKTKENYTNVLANVANVCWMNGYPEMALYLMGKVCMSDMSNGNNLNNYAAFLTMAGGEHAALPILQNLNQKYPNNSTILNNIGQSWYGLGEMNNANKYLDQAIRLCATHSQANLTKATIQKSEGKTQEAIESVKQSIRENYTTEKEAIVNELGGELKYEDIPWKYPGPAEPLGYEKFLNTIPEYPMEGGVAGEFKRKEWDDYREKLSAAEKALGDKIKQLEADVKAYETKVINNPALLKPYNNNVCKTAKRKLTLLIEWGTDRMVDLDKKMRKAVDTVEKWKDEYKEALPEDCGGRLAAAGSFNTKANTLWHQLNYEWMSFQKQFLGSQARLYLYACTDRSEYELNVALIKSYFLSYLYTLRCEFEVGCIKTESEKPAGKILPDFDEMNCEYKDEIFIPPFTKMKFECNKMSTEFKIAPEFNYGPEISPYVKFGFEENLTNNTTTRPSNITKATLEVGAETGSGKIHVGPIEAEAKAEGGVGVEFTEHGVESVYVKAGARADVGPEVESGVSNYTTGAGVETEVSWNAGSEKVESNVSGKFEGKGILSGIHISAGGVH